MKWLIVENCIEAKRHAGRSSLLSLFPRFQKFSTDRGTPLRYLTA
jgi:hypothetical protein